MSLFLGDSILPTRRNSRHLTGTHIPLWKLSSGTLTLFYSFYIQRTLLWIQKVPENQNVCRHIEIQAEKKSADILNQASGCRHQNRLQYADHNHWALGPALLYSCIQDKALELQFLSHFCLLNSHLMLKLCPNYIYII